MSLPRVLADTNVCFAISLLDLVLRLDEAGFHELIWTEDLPGPGCRLTPAAGRMVVVDRDLRDWLRSLAVRGDDGEVRPRRHELSEQDAAYLQRIATDGTLAAALAEIAATEPELAG